MVKGIHIIKYRKLENMELEFSKGINVLSGTNGTCKTSLLHIYVKKAEIYSCSVPISLIFILFSFENVRYNR